MSSVHHTCSDGCRDFLIGWESELKHMTIYSVTAPIVIVQTVQASSSEVVGCVCCWYLARRGRPVSVWGGSGCVRLKLLWIRNYSKINK